MINTQATSTEIHEQEQALSIDSTNNKIISVLDDDL